MGEQTDHALDGFESQEEDDDEVEGFEDYTLASPWERFIAIVEGACRQWQVDRESSMASQCLEGASEMRYFSQVCIYCSTEYTLTYYFSTESSHNSNSRFGALDFEGASKGPYYPEHRVKTLQLLFGVKDLVVLEPPNSTKPAADQMQSEATFLLSTLTVALCNCNSDWPAFVSTASPDTRYEGVKTAGSYSYHYKSDLARKKYASDLLTFPGLFNQFIESKYHDTSTSGQDTVALRLTYRTPLRGSEYGEDGSCKALPSNQAELSEEIWGPEPPWDSECPWADWHSMDDPVKGFEVVATWRNRRLSDATDAAMLENSSALEADKWHLRVVQAPIWTEDATDEANMPGFAGRLQAMSAALGVADAHPFMEDYITASLPGDGSGLTVPPPAVLERVLKDLFESGQDKEDNNSGAQRLLLGKTAPPDSLLSRLALHALRFGTCNIRAIAVLWTEFVRELAICIRMKIAGATEGPEPEREHNNLDDKEESEYLHAQASNRRSSEPDTLTAHGIVKSEADDDLMDTESNETTYESCSDPDSAGFAQPGDAASASDQGAGEKASPSPKRSGTWQPFGNEMLLEVRHRMFAPLTQEAPYMTEDMLEEREQALAGLGNSTSAKETRARMQSGMLASDMAAFKAANPGAVLADFVRWHSPRDRVVREDEVHGQSEAPSSAADHAAWPPAGQLFARMEESGNLWREVWDKAEAAPAFKQRPLFDHTREAEKVMHYLETINPQDLIGQLLDIAAASAAHVLTQPGSLEDNPVLRAAEGRLEALLTTIIPSLGHTKQEQFKYRDLSRRFGHEERWLVAAASLLQKLPTLPALVESLLDEDGLKRSLVLLSDKGMGAERATLADVFSNMHQSSSSSDLNLPGPLLGDKGPTIKEVIMSCPYPSKGDSSAVDSADSQLRERMYALAAPRLLHVATAFVTED
eukprot:SM000051S17519  [mRNA]  locus=s51:39196:45982:+ [translate_table: standard]